MLLQKICLSFLDTRGRRRKGMLSHIPAHSFPSLSWTQREKKKKEEELSGHVPPLSAGRPRGRARRKRETRLRFPAPQTLPVKRDAVQLDLRGDVGGYPDSGPERDARCSEPAEPTQITSVKFDFSDLPSNPTKLKQHLKWTEASLQACLPTLFLPPIDERSSDIPFKS